MRHSTTTTDFRDLKQVKMDSEEFTICKLGVRAEKLYNRSNQWIITANVLFWVGLTCLMILLYLRQATTFLAGLIIICLAIWICLRQAKIIYAEGNQLMDQVEFLWHLSGPDGDPDV